MSTDLPAGGAPAVARRRTPLPWGAVLREVTWIVALFAVAGAIGGWLWHRLADPMTGVAYDGRWLGGVVVQGDYVDYRNLVTDYTDLGRGFGLVAVFVVIGLVGGLAVGTLAAVRARRAELVTLLAVVLGSVLATYLAYRVGVWLGPGDPAQAAKDAADGTVIAGAYELQGKSPWVMWTLGALAGLTFTYVLTTGVEASVSEVRRLDEDPAWPGTTPTTP